MSARSFLRSLIPPALRPWQLATGSLRAQLHASGHTLAKDKQYILGGPFAGTVYVDKSIGSVWEPKVLGTYENELHPIVTALCKQPFANVVNIGAGEGYYAVGFARFGAAKRVDAYEQDPNGQQLIKQLSRENRVEDKVVVHGACDVEQLRQVVSPGSLVVIDVEGFERVLLDPETIPTLRQATILVEVHEVAWSGAAKVLEQRFATTHDITKIVARDRSASDLHLSIPGLSAFITPWLDELRTDGRLWFYMVPKQAV